MKVGDKIKSFEIKRIVKGYYINYDEKGNKTKTIIDFYFLLSDKGQERVMASNKKSLSDCETYRPTFGDKWKYKPWNQFEIIK
jgi:hypothetical protein